MRIKNFDLLRLCEIATPFAAPTGARHSADVMSDPMPDPMQVFDRALVARHRDRAALRLGEHDFLLAEVAERLADRLLDIKREFPIALDLGCRTGGHGPVPGGPGGIEWVARTEFSAAMAAQAPRPVVVADEEFLPFAGGKFDLVYSNLALHWVNDLPGALVQIAAALKPDGLLLAAMLGGETLTELRSALAEAEEEVAGGTSPRISPFADVPDAGALLQRAGFALPVVDSDRITVSYDDPFALLDDLRGMGETNALVERIRRFTRRDVIRRMAAIYHRRHAGDDGRIAATFQVIYLHGWAPDPSQPRPMRPGSAVGRLADALDSRERPAGDKAGPDK